LISKLIKPSYIQLRIHADDWKDAIRKSCLKLVEDNSVNEAYIDEVINAAEEFGPYFVIAKGIAMPHCSSEGNVNNNAISITTLDEPVAFGNETNDPVRFIFTLAPASTKDHIACMAELAELLSDDAFYGVLEDADTGEEVYRYIRKREGE